MIKVQLGKKLTKKENKTVDVTQAYANTHKLFKSKKRKRIIIIIQNGNCLTKMPNCLSLKNHGIFQWWAKCWRDVRGSPTCFVWLF